MSVIHTVRFGLERYFRFVDAPGGAGALVVSVVDEGVG
jgi:hypothetical protein